MAASTTTARFRHGGTQNKALQSASPTPGSTMHKTLNHPKITKHTKKAALTDENMERLAEEVKKLAMTDQNEPNLAQQAIELAEEDQPEEMGQANTASIASVADTNDIIMTDTTTHNAVHRSRITVYKPKAARTSENARINRAAREEKKLADKAKDSANDAKDCEEMNQESPSIIQLTTNTEDITMADTPTSNAISNPSSSAVNIHHRGRAGTRRKMPFYLKARMPMVGMRYPEHGAVLEQRNLLGRCQADAQVGWALWSQNNTKDKNALQALITPIFDQAVLKIQCEGLGSAKEEGSPFQGERCYPKRDGREHPELVRAITRFLDAAGEAGTPWLMAYAEDEKDTEDVDNMKDVDNVDEQDVKHGDDTEENEGGC
ncbi:hypothetical protein VP1G_03212 [Cytospora mali]|uniref:Uncharacterized protein n=1 Tax=Cytospora mali TaxID=578113 RepID=A0A194UW59_CYTMA|nr:hypothetical protein VP1G_03212 [Valsa mali var. pyri (nom. inval.)]